MRKPNRYGAVVDWDALVSVSAAWSVAPVRCARCRRVIPEDSGRRKFCSRRCARGSRGRRLASGKDAQGVLA